MKENVIKEIELHLKLVNDFKNFEVSKVIGISDLIIKTLKSGGNLYLCGNGGSAADAQHVAGELMGKFRLDSMPFSAVSLSTDTSVLTCIGNDYGFDDIFARQVEALVRQNDLLWVFTTSGKSPNIIAACKEAKKRNAKVIAFTGSSGSELKKTADFLLHVNTTITSAIQEIHQIAYHIICGLVEQKLSQGS